MNTLIKNGTVIGEEVKVADIGISGGVIAFVGKDDSFAADSVIDASGKIVMPGLVNAHTHLPMVLFRNYADDMELHDWLFNKIFPLEDKLTAEAVYNASMLGIAELIAGGTTLFADMYNFSEEIARAVDECGIKANLCRAALNMDDSGNYENDMRINEALSLHKHYDGSSGGRIKVDLGLHAVYTSSESYMRHVAELIADMGASCHLHLSETITENQGCAEKYGASPTQLLERAGFFRTPTIAAHCVHLSDADIEILALGNVSAVHCPSSNLKLASGIAPVTKYIAAGINVAIGTDGAASNNNLDMFEEMHIASLLQKGATLDPLALPAAQTLAMATKSGALALGRTDTGCISRGNAADLVIVNPNKPHNLPLGNPLSTLIYSASSSDVETVMVNGNLLMKDGEYLTIDIERVKHNANLSVKSLL